MGQTQPLKKAQFPKWMVFRTSHKQLKQVRTELHSLGYTVSELIRACLSALLSPEDREKILRVIKKHIPEAACLGMAFG
jgi:hypothetical protein